MFAIQFSIKQSKKKLIIFAALGAVLAVICVAATVSILEKPRDTAKSDSRGEYSLDVKNGDFSAFFSQLGIDSESAPESEQSVRIPDEFDEVYNEYNELQKKAGLDLSAYKGKQAKQLKFRLKNGAADYAVLLVTDNRVIGGHLTNGEYKSKMLPLTE